MHIHENTLLLFLQYVYNELEKTEGKIAKLTEAGHKLAEKKSDSAANSIKQSLGILQQRWENIKTRAEDRKVIYFCLIIPPAEEVGGGIQNLPCLPISLFV